MTVEERAEAYAMAQYVSARNKNEETASKNLYWLALKQAYIAGANEDKWTMINQEEDYPPDGQLVLVRDTRDLIYINLCVNGTWHTHMGHPITHWHPLPTPPTTGNKSL